MHIGDSPPDCCPVCGVTSDLFEPSLPTPPPVKKPPRAWRCIVCGYIHHGDSPPEICPICGVGPDQFEPLPEEQEEITAAGISGAIVIIGGGIASLSAAEASRRTAPEASITLINMEDDLPYYRMNLTRYLAGEISVKDLPIYPETWYDEQGITLMNGAEVTSIDRKAGMLSIKGHPDIRYDKLVLAVGAHPSIPPISGTDLKNVVSLRSIRDAETILQNSPAGARCVIIGGGLLSLEAAAALARRKVNVTVLEGFDWLLPRQINRAAGKRLAAEARALGITVICAARIKELAGENVVQGVLLETGESLPADLVIIAAGVRSNTYLARLTGLEVNNGVVVDQYLRTTDPDIYAAGDVAEHQGTVYGTWAASQFQGTITGINAAGGNAAFAGIPRSNSIKVLGIDLLSIGIIHPDDASYLAYEEDGDNYFQFVFRDSRLVGAVLIGDTTLAPTLKKLIENNISCADLLASANSAEEVRAKLVSLQGKT
jgi:nitrite reductase (NADH) large subunit